MRAYWKGLMLVAAFGVNAACGGDGGTGPGASEITGTWQLTKVLFVSQANPQLSVELIGQGATATLTIDPAKTYMTIVTMPSATPDTTTGTWSLGGDVITMVETGSSGNMQFNISLTGNTLKLSGGHVDFDVNQDGIDEPALLSLEGTQ